MSKRHPRVVEPPEGLIASLRRWGVLRTAAVEHALEDLAWPVILPDVPGRRGLLFAPHRDSTGAFDLSPRAAVLLTELLEPKPGLRVALPAPRPRLLEALLRALDVKVHDAARDPPADRRLEIEPAPRVVPLAEDGFALRVGFEPHAESLVKRVHTSEGDAELGLDKLPLHPEAPARPVRHLLVVEGFCRRAMATKPLTRQDQVFDEAVATVWQPRTNADRARLDAARRWFHLGYVHQFSADVLDAIELYRASIDASPTSEAYTFLGWAHSFLGDYEAAMAACEDAIHTDASFGNPFNDLGAYLLELGRADEALPWFEKALDAPRYDAPHFAYCNAGRALMELGRVADARRCFERALAAAPGYRPARELLDRADAEA